jgi:hypothetical protein
VLSSLAAVFVALLSLLGPSVTAADTGPPIPTLPEPAGHVVVILAPSVTPVCGTTAIVSALGPAALASLPAAVGDPAQQVIGTVGPTLIILCGALPSPDSNGYTCQVDSDNTQTIADLVSPVSATVASVVLLATPQVAKTAMNQTHNLMAELPAAAQGLPVEPTVAGVLQCATPKEASTVIPPDDAAPSADDVAAPDEGTVLTFTPLPELVESTGVPVLDVAPQAPILGDSAPATSRTYGFQYAAVLLAPIALVMGTAFVGRTLTRELAQRRTRP